MTETADPGTPTLSDSLREMLTAFATTLSDNAFRGDPDDLRFRRISESLTAGNIADVTPDALRWYVREAQRGREQDRGLKGNLARLLSEFLR